jgi:hypothetical protein
LYTLLHLIVQTPWLVLITILLTLTHVRHPVSLTLFRGHLTRRIRPLDNHKRATDRHRYHDGRKNKQLSHFTALSLLIRFLTVKRSDEATQIKGFAAFIRGKRH